MLCKGSTVLYGLVPLLLFFSLAIWLYEEHYQKGSLAYHRVLPVNYQQVILGILLGLTVMSTIYVLVTVICTLVFSGLSGIPLGSLDYPVRLFSSNGYMASHVSYHPIWSMTPFAHLDSVAIVSGTRFIETGNSMFSVGPSIVVLILWKLIFLVITTLRTTPKRDYLS